MTNDEREGRVEIPRILQEVPPEKLRELVEVLLGGRLKEQSFGWENKLIEGPTEDQGRRKHHALAGRRRLTLHFETDWLPLDDVDEFARSVSQAMYLGAVSNSRYLEDVDGPERSCVDEWKRIAGLGANAGAAAKMVGGISLAALLSKRGLKRLAKAAIRWITDGMFELDTEEEDR